MNNSLSSEGVTNKFRIHNRNKSLEEKGTLKIINDTN